LGIFVVLLVIAWFVGTSSAFFKSVILPRAGKALNANITVSDAAISPFSQVILHDLKVQTTGPEPLVAAREARLRYSLMDIIAGHIHVDELALISPTLTLIENPDKTSNLDPIRNAQQAKEKERPAETKPPQPSKPSKPAQIDVKKLALTDATIRQIKNYPGGHRDLTELSHINLTMTDLKNGQPGKLALSADINIQNNPPPPGTNGLLQAKLNGNFTFALSPELKPASIQGNTRLEIARAEGAMAQLSTLAATLDCNATPTEITEIALRFQRGDTTLGQLRASGPFDLEKTEGRLTIELLNIDKNLLNLAGAASGLDFGPTTINSTNEIQLTKAAAAITAAGQFNLNQFQLTRTNQTTPPLDLRAEYNVTVDRSASNALVRTFILTATQKGNPVLKGELSSPMQIAWGNAGNPMGDSALNLTVNHLDLADWRPFLGEVAPIGDVNAKLKLLSQEGGKQLTFDLNSQIANLTAGSGSNQISHATVTFDLRGQAADMKQFKLPQFKFQLAQENRQLITASGSATYDTATTNADAQLDAQIMLAEVLQAFPSPGVSASSGTAELKAHASQKSQPTTLRAVAGTFTLANFTGQFGSNNLQNWGLTSDLDIAATPEQVQIQKLAGKVTEGQAAGGSFEVSGTYGLSNKATRLTAKLTDFNQAGLRPFLEPMLADKKLVSIALNASASVQYDPRAPSSIKADLQVANLVVNDPKGQFPGTPLEAKCQLDTSLDKSVATIRQFIMSLTPTDRATNQVQLTGQIDTSNTNAITGNLKLAADSLDVTRYYDLFAGEKKAPEQTTSSAHPQSAPPTAGAGPSPPEKEPEGKSLPFKNFTTEANIRRFYLREVEITNLLTTVKLDGGHIDVNPCKLAVNGGPINTTVALDTSVPGYKYDTSFSAQSVPLAPFVNSFQPERKGQVAGSFTAQAKINGVGTTGASLQKSLAGQFDLTSTNLNLQVANIKNPVLKLLVNVISSIPDLAKNPAGAAGALVSSIFEKPAARGGLAGELQKSPINSITAHGSIGAGKVDLREAVVQSPAFEAAAKGTITLAEVLTNSAIQIPVSVSLNRSVAERINLVPANTPTNALYAKLPDFLTLTGTLGKPDKKINALALGTTAVRGVGSFVGGDAGKVLRGLGSLGGTSTSTNAPGTNQSGGLLRGLGNLLGTPPANTNAPTTNRNRLLDLFPRK
jgi:hypothetical protein